MEHSPMTSPTHTFRLARMSPLYRGATIFALALALAVPAILFIARSRTMGSPQPMPAWIPGAITGLLWAVLLGSWGLMVPRRFEIDETELRIVCPLRTQRIARADITAPRPIPRDELGMLLRTGGVGGFFGSFGWHRGLRFGPLTLYITRTDGLVLVPRRSARPLLLTPDRPGEFVQVLRGNAPERQGS